MNTPVRGLSWAAAFDSFYIYGRRPPLHQRLARFQRKGRKISYGINYNAQKIHEDRGALHIAYADAPRS